MRTELEIGRVLKPRGLKGEVKAKIYSQDPRRFADIGGTLRVGERELDVENFSSQGGFAYIKFKGIDSAETAETLRSKYIYAKRATLPPLGEGEHYIVDIIGLEVFAGAQSVGRIVDVLQYGSADVYVVRNDHGTLSFPALKQLIRDVDPDGGSMKLDEVVFDRVVVYNY